MNPSFSVRYATSKDAELIALHRSKMFRDNHFASPETLTDMSKAFVPWVRDRIEDGRYVGVFITHEEDDVVAGAGIFFADFPPHWRHMEAERPYILNVYTDEAHRGQGLARELMRQVLGECRKRHVTLVSLHASPQGRSIYERLGFFDSDEMLIDLGSLPYF